MTASAAKRRVSAQAARMRAVEDHMTAVEAAAQDAVEAVFPPGTPRLPAIRTA